jgi:cytochrome oxidase assembly protein ShyY1
LYYRATALSKPSVDITPKNGGAFPWTGQDTQKFEQEWSMKPVTVRGFLDHNKEIKVEKQMNGEKGVEVITPFFTHLDKNEEPCAILVNRGWLAWDLRNFRFDRENDTT